MGKIACTKQGAQQFKELALTLRQCNREIDEAATEMMQAVSGVNDLGDFKEPIENSVRNVKKIVNESKEPIENLTNRIYTLANNIEMIVRKYS